MAAALAEILSKSVWLTCVSLDCLNSFNGMSDNLPNQIVSGPAGVLTTRAQWPSGINGLTTKTFNLILSLA